MKVLYVLRSTGYLYYHAGILRSLCRQGHTVQVLVDHSEKDDASEQVARGLQAEVAGLQFGTSLRRADLWRTPLFAARELINYARYLRPEGQSEYYRKRWERFLPVWARPAVRSTAGRKLLVHAKVQRALRAVERSAGPDRRITQELRAIRPDVVVASPANLRHSEEIEYVKAAKAVGTPTAVPILSWDNLTTKGLFHVLPDLLLVWNRQQQQEATGLLGVPAERIVITGAPPFDRWLEDRRPAVDRAAFCKQAGLDPSKPFVVYLGSSANIAADETWLVEELAACLAAGRDESLAQTNVLVRPHPANVKNYARLSAANLRVWPAARGLPQTPEALQDYFHTLYYAECAVGLNTSGMIDAVVAGRPCLTILVARYQLTQANAIHFQTMLRADILQRTSSAAECAAAIGGILGGQDCHQAQRQEFVAEYIRPCGPTRTAADLVRTAIEMAAVRRPAADINRALNGGRGPHA